MCSNLLLGGAFRKAKYEKSIATDILKSLNLKYKGRNFTKMFENFIWVKRRVSKEVNKKLKIDKKQRKEITNEQFADIENKKTLDSVKYECVSYFKNKLEQR